MSQVRPFYAENGGGVGVSPQTERRRVHRDVWKLVEQTEGILPAGLCSKLCAGGGSVDA